MTIKIKDIRRLVKERRSSLDIAIKRYAIAVHWLGEKEAELKQMRKRKRG